MVNVTDTVRLGISAAALTLSLGAAVPASAADTRLWQRQIDSGQGEWAAGVAVDKDGNVYVGGTTWGSLAAPNKGIGDAWVAKYAGDGTLLWNAQFGTSDAEMVGDLTRDDDGNVYLAGYSTGSLGDDNAGSSDAFVAKYAGNGAQLWIRQVGSSDSDYGRRVAVDRDGNVYLVGATSGAFAKPNREHNDDGWIVKFAPSGTELWRRQLGTKDTDTAWGVATDRQGNVFVGGYTTGAFAGKSHGNFDGWLIKLDETGQQIWRRQFGSAEFDAIITMTTDAAGNVFLGGVTQGTFAGNHRGGLRDAVVIAYDPDGRQTWRRQIGSEGDDNANGITTDAAGNVYVIGNTDGNIGHVFGGPDAWAVKLDPSGQLVWRKQAGTARTDSGEGIAVDDDGDIYLAGTTDGSLAGPNRGGNDAWLRKYRLIQTP